MYILYKYCRIYLGPETESAKFIWEKITKDDRQNKIKNIKIKRPWCQL